MVSQLKINPDRPIRPFSTDNSSKHHTQLVPKPEPLLSKTKANSPDTPLKTSDQGTPVHQSVSLPNSKKRSIEKAISSSSTSKKKAKWFTTRRSSKRLDPNGNIYKDQECNLGKTFATDNSQSPGMVDIAKNDMSDSSNDTTYSDSNGKHLNHGEPESKPYNMTAYVSGNPDAETGSAEDQMCRRSSNCTKVGYVKLNEARGMATEIVHAECPTPKSQESTPSRYSPEEVYSVIENRGLGEGRTDVYQTPVKKVINSDMVTQAIIRLSLWYIQVQAKSYLRMRVQLMLRT